MMMVASLFAGIGGICLGFPEGFNIFRDNTIEDAYKQIGNSVCVSIINRLAMEIAKVLERKVL